MSNRVLPPAIPYRRMLEWWCVLNAKRRPSDLPKEISSDEGFLWIQEHTKKADRLELWNSEYQQGAKPTKFISP